MSPPTSALPGQVSALTAGYIESMSVFYRRCTAIACLTGSLVACGYDVQVNAPGSHSSIDSTHATTDSTTAGDTTHRGTLQRTDLTVTVTVAGGDSAIAAALGSPGGVLTGAIVTVQRSGAGTRSVDTTGAQGLASFAGLLPGAYSVSVSRLLTPTEVASLGQANGDVNAMVGGATLNVAGNAAVVAVPAVAGRRGSLVISEIFPAAPTDEVAKKQYLWGTFIELYNNADTTIYLDGKVIGTVGVVFRNNQRNTTCDQMAPWRNDPDGIWSIFLDAFPGSGHDYPLAPGHTAVVATDAIDHSVAWPGLLDLSHADFEFKGSNDVDNPVVPNMLDIGLMEFDPAFSGHGMDFVLAETVFLADSLTVSALPRYTPPYGIAVVRIPANKILDVFTTAYTPDGEASLNALGFPLCPQLVNQGFDRQYANFLDPTTQLIQSMRRKTFATLPDGRVILLRTKSSANDFEVAQPSPGTVGK